MRTRVTPASASAYGGSANTTSYRPSAGPRASTRSTRSAMTAAPGSPIASMFCLMTRAARAP